MHECPNCLHHRWKRRSTTFICRNCGFLFDPATMEIEKIREAVEALKIREKIEAEDKLFNDEIDRILKNAGY